MFNCMGQKSDYPKSAGYTFRVFEEDKPRIDAAAKLSNRKRSETAKFLLKRALDLFEKDFKLSEGSPPVVDPSDPKVKAALEGGKKEKGHRVS